MISKLIYTRASLLVARPISQSLYFPAQV